MNLTLSSGEIPDRATQEVLNAIPVGVVIVAADLRILFMNQSASEYFDGDSARYSTLEQFHAAFCLIDPQTGEMVADEELPLSRALRGESADWEEYGLRRAAGGPRTWIECTASPAESGAVLTFRDVTARKERELAHEAAGRRGDFIYHENLAGIMHCALDGWIIDCNDAILKMWGYETREELLAVRDRQLYWEPRDRDRLLRLVKGAGRVSELEICFRRKDGSKCWCLLNVRLLGPQGGNVDGTIVSTVIDITERRAQEETLNKSERRFAAFMKHLPGVAFIKDPSGRYVYYNDASWALFQKRPEDIVGRTDDEIWPAGDAERYRKNDAAVMETRRPVEFMEPVAHADGTHSWLIWKFPIVENGQVAFVGGIGIDITERRILEDQLTHARKMEALGRLAGGIAHDFNNLLTVISGYGQLALEGMPQIADPMTEYLRQILNAARRASGLTEQLLAFSRHEAAPFKRIDLGELLRNMELLLQRIIGEHVQLTVRCGAGPLPISADSNQIEQLVMNLAVNARDAMPLGGSLDFTCGRMAEPLEREGGEPLAIEFKVRDNGIGMDETTRSRIFDPFFTLKERGRGTGLGLSTVYGIVSRSKGTIEVESAPGEGTVFRICFPESRQENRELGPVPVTETVRGSETVLLVEDEPALRLLAEKMLAELGYKVLAADCGQAAMKIWEERGGKVDVLLTDVIMPRMSGGELAGILRERNPGLRILFMSGYTDDMLAAHGVLSGETQLLQKPFTAGGLGRKLRDVLEA